MTNTFQYQSFAFTLPFSGLRKGREVKTNPALFRSLLYDYGLFSRHYWVSNNKASFVHLFYHDN